MALGRMRCRSCYERCQISRPTSATRNGAAPTFNIALFIPWAAARFVATARTGAWRQPAYAWRAGTVQRGAERSVSSRTFSAHGCRSFSVRSRRPFAQLPRTRVSKRRLMPCARTMSACRALFAGCGGAFGRSPLIGPGAANTRWDLTWLKAAIQSIHQPEPLRHAKPSRRFCR